jgi:sugar phosphate isomerase/epimerase
MKKSMVMSVSKDGLDVNRAKMIKSAGFDALDICFYERDELMLSSDYLAILENIGESIQKIGLECIHTHLYSYPLQVSGCYRDENTDLAIRRSIEASALLGAKRGVIHPRSSIADQHDTEIAFTQNKTQFTELIEYAEKYNVDLAIENIPVFPDNPAGKFYTSDYKDLIRLVDALDSKRICICWDFGHAHLMDFDHPKAILEAGLRIKAIHVHNNSRTGDFHQPPSCGSLKWPPVMKALGDTGYDQLFTIELPFPPIEVFESWLAHIYDCTVYLTNLMK